MLLCSACGSKDFVFAENRDRVLIIDSHRKVKRQVDGHHEYELRTLLCHRCGSVPLWKNERGVQSTPRVNLYGYN